jgi:S-DNA-T family DNA segregation ATPase FtsK/SpoIIIE
MKKKGKISSRHNSNSSSEGAKKGKALIFVGIGIFLLLLCSCISFDIGDWPSKFVYPHNKPPSNWCGSIGAFCAYYMLYYFGPGVFVILMAAICFLIARLFKRPLGQPILRAIGLGLLTTAASSSFYCFWPHQLFIFPTGSGGLLGVGAATFLRSHFATLGTFILITATWFVGVILVADSILLWVLLFFTFVGRKLIGIVVPAWSVAKHHSEAVSDIWRKLSAKQKSLAASVASMSISKFREDKPAPAIAAPEKQSESITMKQPKPIPAKKPVDDPSNTTFGRPVFEDYVLPPLELLAEAEYSFASVQEKVVKEKAAALEKLLMEFNINARVVEAETGPVVTMFELELAAGVKVSQISTLANDIARALSAGAVRVVAPLRGKHTIGIEVPNNEKEKVRMRNIMELAGKRARNMEIPLFLGKDSSGEALVSDLTSMPHLLIAGTTGSGKSVCINTVIVGILLTKRPDEVKLILVDPKMVEMTAFNTVPHLMCPIVTETQTAVQILEWATVKMDERYALLAEARVKNIAEYNRLGSEELLQRFNPSSPDEEEKIPKKLAYIVIIIDELADLMMTAPKEIEAYIVRLAQKSRAVGIHIVLATQRPQSTVVTGLIKSNMPTRIGFRVAAKLDSRIVLDQNGAETLLGEGDMLFLKPGTSDLIRAQGTFVDEGEVKRIVRYLKDIAEPQFHPELTQLKKIDASEMRRDELFDDAVRIVLETHRGSVSLLQRRLNVGYARASRMIEMMAAAGILGEYKGSQAREVIITMEEYERLRESVLNEEKENEDSSAEDESSEPAYGFDPSTTLRAGKLTTSISEGQQGYVSVDNEED